MPSGAGLVLLRAGRGRHLHAARRRGGARAPAHRSGHAAFLLAVGRLLRPVHVLVQRPARSRRLGVLLGRRDRADGAAAAVPALHAGLPGASAPSGLFGDCSRAGCPPIYLPGAVLGSTRALAVLRSGIDPEYFVRVIALLDRLEYVYLAAFFAAGLAVLLRALVARALGDRQAPAALDRVGHGARRAAVRARLRDSVRARRRSVDPDGPAARFRSASSRSRLRRRSFAIA